MQYAVSRSVRIRWVLLCLLQGIGHSHIMRPIASGYGLDMPG